MTTAAQYNTTFQPVRELDIKINVLDEDMNPVDEISGVTTQANISVDANADIRRTANITMIVHADYMPTGVQSVDIGTIWTSGSPYWFDKYIQIYVGIENMDSGEMEWVNQGIYLINSPSINYDASTSELSFSGVDLMSKLTGMRNGQLEGMTYQITAGSTITTAVKSILEEQGFTNAIIKTPPTEEVPNDISVDVGGTAYDLLTQLRDINPNWEMFFDVDGVFYFQEIPSATPTESPIVTDGIWNELGISYSIDTSFEDVKNYIEVVGKTVEADEEATASIDTQTETLTVTLGRNYSAYYSSVADTELWWRFNFVLGSLSSQPVEQTAGIYKIIVKDASNVSHTYQFDEDLGLHYTNQAYFITMKVDDESVLDVEMGGYLEIKAIAFEDNAESPFYVGDVKGGALTTEAGGAVSWGNTLDILTTVTPSAYTTNVQTGISTATLNISPWVDKGAWSSGALYNTGDIVSNGGSWWKALQSSTGVTPSSGDYWTTVTGNLTWRFYLDISAASNPVGVLNITASTYTNPSLQMLNAEASPAYVSADYTDGTYVLECTKSSTSTMTATLYYIAVPASNWETPTTKIYSLPKFSKMVREVCSGDEYDNIYTNSLAAQRAKYEVYLRARLHDTMSITCVPIYWLDVHTLISCTPPNATEASLWLIETISTDLGVTGTQSITATKFYPLYEEQQIASNVGYLRDSNGNRLLDSNGNYLTVVNI